MGVELRPGEMQPATVLMRASPMPQLRPVYNTRPGALHGCDHTSHPRQRSDHISYPRQRSDHIPVLARDDANVYVDSMPSVLALSEKPPRALQGRCGPH